jgi:hypothetical protein
MQPHEERVVNEQKELSEKIVKLNAFIGGPIFKTLHGAEQSLLERQLVAMQQYSGILQQRIEMFA